MVNKKLQPKELALIITSLATVLYLGWFLGANKIISLPNPITKFDNTKIDLVSKTVYANYFPPFDNPQKFENVFLTAMLNSLNDPNSYYSTPSEYEKIKQTVKNPNLTLTQSKDNVYILRFDWFTENLLTELQPHIDTLTDSPDSKLIVDLRTNTGGNLNSALAFVNLFIDKGSLIKEIYKDKEVVQNASPRAPLSKINVYIIISSETSSSAEIAASVLQEKGVATIIGEKSFGKNSIGNFFELPDKSAIHLTIGKWVTFEGYDVGGIGINPDILVEDVGKKSYEDLMKYIH